MVPVPKKVKYKFEIFDAIVYSLLFKNQEIHINYNELYRQVANKLNIQLSKRDFQSHITKLIDDGMISKNIINDNKKTLPESSYYLTTKGKKIDSLKLTGADYEYNRSKKKKLYLLLLCFDFFKRGRIISERQLPNFLKKYDSSIDKLKIINDENINQESFSNFAMFRKDMTLYQTSNDIQILKFKNANDKKYYYYIVILGLSVDEFKFYIELIKKGKEPHPFSENRNSMEIPIISYLDFSIEEIEDAISILKQNDIIKPIKSIIPGEMRYDVKDDKLKKIFGWLWFLHIIDFHIVINRLIDYDKPLESDLKFLTFYYGQMKASKMLSFLYDYKKKYKKDLINDNITSEFSKDIEEQRKTIANAIKSLYKKIITKTENYFIVSLIKDVCLPIDGVT